MTAPDPGDTRLEVVNMNESGQVASGAVVWVVGVLLCIALVIWILPHLSH